MNSFISIVRGCIIWNLNKNRYKINYNKAVIVLPEKDDEWNMYALVHLKDYMHRKNVKEAIIYCMDINIHNKYKECVPSGVKFIVMSETKMKLMCMYYCLHEFFFNIVFFYIDFPKDNMSKRIIEDGISKEELICLGFYNLREVPYAEVGE